MLLDEGGGLEDTPPATLPAITFATPIESGLWSRLGQWKLPVFELGFTSLVSPSWLKMD